MLAFGLPSEKPRLEPAAAGHRRSIVRLLRNRQLIATDAVGLCVLFTQVAMFTYVVNYTDPSIAALSSLFIGATVLAVWLADRYLDLSRVFLRH